MRIRGVDGDLGAASIVDGGDRSADDGARYAVEGDRVNPREVVAGDLDLGPARRLRRVRGRHVDGHVRGETRKRELMLGLVSRDDKALWLEEGDPALVVGPTLRIVDLGESDPDSRRQQAGAVADDQ